MLWFGHRGRGQAREDGHEHDRQDGLDDDRDERHFGRADHGVDTGQGEAEHRQREDRAKPPRVADDREAGGDREHEQDDERHVAQTERTDDIRPVGRRHRKPERGEDAGRHEDGGETRAQVADLGPMDRLRQAIDRVEGEAVQPARAEPVAGSCDQPRDRVAYAGRRQEDGPQHPGTDRHEVLGASVEVVRRRDGDRTAVDDQGGVSGQRGEGCDEDPADEGEAGQRDDRDDHGRCCPMGPRTHGPPEDTQPEAPDIGHRQRGCEHGEDRDGRPRLDGRGEEQLVLEEPEAEGEGGERGSRDAGGGGDHRHLAAQTAEHRQTGLAGRFGDDAGRQEQRALGDGVGDDVQRRAGRARLAAHAVEGDDVAVLRDRRMGEDLLQLVLGEGEDATDDDRREAGDDERVEHSLVERQQRVDASEDQDAGRHHRR